MFLSVPEQFLKEAEDRLQFYKLNADATQAALTQLGGLKGLDHAKLLQLLKKLNLPYVAATIPFYNKLIGTEAETRIRLLALAFILCSEWEESTKSKLLFEAYAGQSVLSQGNATDMIADIYKVVIEAVPAMLEVPLVKNYLSTIEGYKEEVKAGLITSLLKDEERDSTELTLTEFQLKFETYKVKFLNCADARTSFKRYATVKHITVMRENARSTHQEVAAEPRSAMVDTA
eukprot:CAMPEP_0204909262 /NCGR_PEP_ID=MMETSP1397-20131031/8016_1 /ASSEMBLY_ACC=CAM_ASM_000891 /TAXON_ID=49980 /ORGANISM="Climacostomum Climacostomum virens, Strain Stock W-24" /LENGTH=231 /DNA_ID=CAMNT_0052079035 /DNA_START=268 /DNA_END=963 /DNA_ORIENTATION=-